MQIYKKTYSLSAVYPQTAFKSIFPVMKKHLPDEKPDR
jgi:hypothetical protein